MKKFLSTILILTLLTGSYVFFKAPKAYASIEIIGSSGTWVAPLSITSIYVSTNGGGGGGGGGFAIGGGGGGGACQENGSYSVTPGNSYSISIGAGGAGGTSGDDGDNGGSTTFDGGMSAAGGGGGQGSNNGGAGGTGASGIRDGGSGFSLNSNPNSNGGSSANCPSGTGGADGGATGNPGDGGNGGVLADGQSGVSGWVYISYTLSADTPTGLAATSGLNAHIPVSWNAVTTTVVSGYRLYRNDDGYTSPIYDGTSLSFDDTSVVNGVTYSYKVTSYNADAESAKSGAVSATSVALPVASGFGDISFFGDW